MNTRKKEEDCKKERETTENSYVKILRLCCKYHMKHIFGGWTDLGEKENHEFKMWVLYVFNIYVNAISWGIWLILICKKCFCFLLIN